MTRYVFTLQSGGEIGLCGSCTDPDPSEFGLGDILPVGGGLVDRTITKITVLTIVDGVVTDTEVTE